MFKSVFFKCFSVIAAVIAGGFLAMTLLQFLLTTRFLAAEKKDLLQENAQNIAHHIVISATNSYISEKGEVVYQMDLKTVSPFLRMLSDTVDAHILISDSRGRVLLSSDKQLADGGDAALLQSLLPRIEDGYYEVGTLDGLYENRRYTAAVPVLIDNRTLAYVFVSSPADSLTQTLYFNLRIYAVSVAGALLLSCLVLWFLTYRFARPLRQMAAATRCFAQGDFSARVTVKGKDEVAELADALNHMAVSLSSVETMQRSFIANVSHELKTPMTTIAGFLDGILDGTIPPEKQAQYMQIVSNEVKRLSRLVHSILNLSRIDSGEVKMNTVRFDLTDVVGTVLVSSEQRIEDKGLHITGMEECGKMEMFGDYDLMSQVLYNLLDNAIKFTNEGGDIDIRLHSGEGRIYVKICNTGAGIPADEMPRIFQKFYKSDRSRSLDKNGMGLGLYIVKSIIRLHGGEVAVRSVEGEFTEFSFWVPAASIS